MTSFNFSCYAQTAKKYLWVRPNACSLGAVLGYSLLLHHPLTAGMCLCSGELVWFSICSRSDMHPSLMAVHSGLILVSDGGNWGKCELVEFIRTAQSRWRLGLQTMTKKWLQPIERVESKILSLIFLFTAFHKAGKVLRITPNFSLSLKPETPYLRREITEHLGRDCTSALLFYELLPLWGLIYDLCRNPHLSPNLALNHAALICSELFLGSISLI